MSRQKSGLSRIPKPFEQMSRQNGKPLQDVQDHTLGYHFSHLNGTFTKTCSLCSNGIPKPKTLLISLLIAAHRCSFSTKTASEPL